MLSDRIHHDTESQDMAAHNEDGEQELANTKKLASKRAE